MDIEVLHNASLRAGRPLELITELAEITDIPDSISLDQIIKRSNAQSSDNSTNDKFVIYKHGINENKSAFTSVEVKQLQFS